MQEVTRRQTIQNSKLLTNRLS